MKKLYPPLFFAGVAILMFWKVLFHEEFTILSGRDTAAAYYPWFDVAAYWLKRGVMLLWDPYVYAGKLNMGEPQPGIFYPLNWLFMLLPAQDGGMSPEGMQFLLILDYLLAALFFYYLARSFHLAPSGAALAGISWAFGGYTAQIYGYANVLGGFVWFPPAFITFRSLLSASTCRERIRWVLLCGLFLALSFLPGHHIPPVHIGLFLAFFALYHVLSRWRISGWREKVLPFSFLFLVAGTAASLTALQWIPSAEWAHKVYRWVGEGPPVQWGQAVPYSSLQKSSNINPQDAVSLIFPYMSTNANIYTGFAVLFLAMAGLLFARKNGAGFFGLGVFVYFFLSWGRFSALHGWVNTFVPGAWFAREVFYYLVMLQACLAMLAGFGLDLILESYGGAAGESLRAFMRRCGWAMAGILALCAALLPVLRLGQQMPMEHPYMKGVAGLATYVCIVGLLLFMLRTSRIRPQIFGICMLGLVLVDLSSQLSADMPLKAVAEGQENTYVRAVWKTTPAVEFLKSQQKTEHFRVDDPQGVFPPNFGDAWRLRATMGHGATALVDYLQFRGTGWGPSSNATALLNVRYIASRIQIPGMEKVFEGDPSIYVNTRAVPRFFLAGRYRSFQKRSDLLEWIPTPLFAPLETVLLQHEDVETLPRDFLRGVESESQALDVHARAYRTAAEKEAERITDDTARRQLHLNHPPWGWSDGDEVSFAAFTSSHIPNSFLCLNYFPTSFNVSRITVHKKSRESGNSTVVELPGLPISGKKPDLPSRVWMDLGPLNPGEHRISLTRTSECSANIDSIRMVKDRPAAEEDNIGNVSLISSKPNRILLKAKLKRPGFLVASEVYYPGWTAEVNGMPAPLLRADYILRALALPAGAHEVALYFRSKSFRWGLIVSLLSLSCFSALMIYARTRGG